MNHRNSDTKWFRHYSYRFDLKFDTMRKRSDKIVVEQRTIDIANHPIPDNVGGADTCPEGYHQKIIFNTGLVILYEFIKPHIIFIAFYYR